jgi:hypothetical protein
MCRQANIELPKTFRAHPDQLAFFAALRVPEVEASLIEIDLRPRSHGGQKLCPHVEYERYLSG